MALTTFWVISRGFTCFNLQPKHTHLVDPKRTVRMKSSRQVASIAGAGTQASFIIFLAYFLIKRDKK